MKAAFRKLSTVNTTSLLRNFFLYLFIMAILIFLLRNRSRACCQRNTPNKGQRKSTARKMMQKPARVILILLKARPIRMRAIYGKGRPLSARWQMPNTWKNCVEAPRPLKQPIRKDGWCRLHPVADGCRPA